MSNKKRARNPQLSGQQQSKATPWIIAFVVLLCVGAVVSIVVLNSGDGDDASASDPSASVSEDTGTPSTSSSSGDSPLDCTDPPAAPTSPEQFDAAPDPATAQGKTFDVTVETNCGEIKMELDGTKAPQTVASFVHLAEAGFFDDTPCHRLVVSGIYVLQCGDPTGQGSGGPGYQFGIENAPANGQYPRGTLAMARTSDPNSNGSQFFMVYADTTLPTDGGGYSVFGKVTDGLPLLEMLADNGVAGGGTDGAPKQPISILSVRVSEQ
jgi:peptidyl-prolyl cis-trans isomerase B (cyclophilin B)